MKEKTDNEDGKIPPDPDFKMDSSFAQDYCRYEVKMNSDMEGGLPIVGRYLPRQDCGDAPIYILYIGVCAKTSKDRKPLYVPGVHASI